MAIKILKFKLGETRVGVFTNCYGSSLEFITMLATELKKDYPNLKDDEIDIKQLGGPRYSGIFTVETTVESASDILEEYESYPKEWMLTK